ncbi:hypothetical protein BDZ89DRAFT_145913 [Hymenopellis radicata]|nr:hypothetical protein BDZ89DRAFT_145913 [Hymenopellis radicata]
MSIRLVKTPFAAPAYRDGGAGALYSVDTNVPSSSTSTRTPKGPRKAFTGFKGGVFTTSEPFESPTTPLNYVRDTPSASSSFPKRTPISHRRASPYADAYPGKSPSTRPFPSGRSALHQEGGKVDYSKQVAGMLLSRVNDGRIPRPLASRSRSYVKSGLSRVAVSF